jgi:hypothetical protein
MLEQVSLSTDYQPHSAHTWLVIAIVNSGAKYAEKIIPKTITDRTYKTKREIEIVEMFIKKLCNSKALNCSLFNR